MKRLLQVEAVGVKPVPPKTQQTILEWEADTVLEITPAEGEPFILHMEWQSTNDPRMAFRMARYDLLLCESYRKKVMGVVIYVGEKPMTMVNSFESFGLQYNCPMIDIRDISPDVFLSSDDPGEVVLAILAGRENTQEVIRRILHKLHMLTAGDTASFAEKLKHLELLAQLRGPHLEELLIKEEENMPINIDIRKDLRFKQGMAEGKQEGKLEGKKEDAVKMLEMGIQASLVEEVTGLSMAEIREWQNRLKA